MGRGGVLISAQFSNARINHADGAQIRRARDADQGESRVKIVAFEPGLRPVQAEAIPDRQASQIEAIGVGRRDAKRPMEGTYTQSSSLSLECILSPTRIVSCGFPSEVKTKLPLSSNFSCFFSRFFSCPRTFPLSRSSCCGIFRFSLSSCCLSLSLISFSCYFALIWWSFFCFFPIDSASSASPSRIPPHRIFGGASSATMTASTTCIRSGCSSGAEGECAFACSLSWGRASSSCCRQRKSSTSMRSTPE